MKRLLTFIYGLIHLPVAFYFENQFDICTEWYRWLYFIGILVMVTTCVEKLNKATK